MNNQIGVVVLSAGKGTRLKCVDSPKVMCQIGGKPIVSFVVETLKKAGFTKENIVLVVGFHKEKIMDYFGDAVTFAPQEEQKGTAHAAYVGMRALPKDIKQVLVLNGDDAAFYTYETLNNFIEKHLENKATASLLTVEPENYWRYGRVVRDSAPQRGPFEGGIEIVEKENLTEAHKDIKETSTGTFCFERDWFEKIFPNLKPIKNLGEYGLPSAWEEAVKEGKITQAIKLKNNDEWFGINTPEELAEANKRKLKI